MASLKRVDCMYMEKNLDITKPLFRKRTLSVLWPFVISGFRCIGFNARIYGRFLQHLEDVPGNGRFAFGLFRQCITSYIAG